MDVLVVVGNEPPPTRLGDRSRYIRRFSSGESTESLIGALRARIPRRVGVCGPVAEAAPVAVSLRQAGLPIELFTDEQIPEETLQVLAGVDVRQVSDPGPPMDVADSLVELIGNTPMVRLDRTAKDLECTLVAKLELFNPGGSSKDRIALAMIEAAEQGGQLLPGGTIVEPTSGNTGVGLAIVAARKGYKCVFVCPDKVASDKIALLRARMAPKSSCARPRCRPNTPNRTIRSLTVWPARCLWPGNPTSTTTPTIRAQYETAGAEIWTQTRGRVTHFVAGIGTGGTVTGIGRYLKERNASVQVIGADPEGSVYSGGSGRPYLVEGIGEDFWPTTYDPSVVDRVVAISDAESFATARRVTREEGLLLGGSGGTAIAAAQVVGRDLPPEAVVVVHIPDSGRGYLSKIYNDSWMADYGFLHEAGPTVGDILAAHDASLPSLVHTHPDETVRQAIAIFREYGISQMPVIKHEPPVVLAEVVGGVTERDLMDCVFGDSSMLDRGVSDVMGEPLPTIGAGEQVQVAVGRLEGAAALVVLDRGHPVGVITRSDVLATLATGSHLWAT